MALDPFMPVLVVDTHGATIQVVRSLLRQVGFVDIDDVNNGAEALKKMHLKRYGLVVSEWHLGSTTGNELLRDVRSDSGLKRIPFIVIGESSPENVIAAKKAGANIYIVKPFDAQTLKAKIEAAFATRAAPLPERQLASTAPEPPHLSEGSDVPSIRFTGRFTGCS